MMHDPTISRPDSDAGPSPRRAVADPNGQAALFLSESILHALVDAKTLTLAQAIGVVQTAYEVTADLGDGSVESKSRTQQSLNLLSSIEQSLATGESEDHPTGVVRLIKP